MIAQSNIHIGMMYKGVPGQHTARTRGLKMKKRLIHLAAFLLVQKSFDDLATGKCVRSIKEKLMYNQPKYEL